MDSKLLATKTHAILKEMGIEIKLSQVYEMYSKVSGYKSWNVAKVNGGLTKITNLLSPLESVTKPALLALELMLNSDNYFAGKIDGWWELLPKGEVKLAKVASYLITNPKFISLTNAISEKHDYNLFEEVEAAAEVVDTKVVAAEVVDALELAVNTFPENIFNGYVSMWYSLISKDWESESDRVHEILCFIKLNPKFDEIRNKIKSKYPYMPSFDHFDSLQVEE